MLKLCGIALLCAFCALVVKETGGTRFAVALTALSGVLLVLPLLAKYGEVMNFLSALSENTLFSESFRLSTKALSVGLLASFTADLCRELGEGGLGEKLELFAKAEILVLALPTLSRLLSICTDLMRG